MARGYPDYFGNKSFDAPANFKYNAGSASGVIDGATEPVLTLNESARVRNGYGHLTLTDWVPGSCGILIYIDTDLIMDWNMNGLYTYNYIKPGEMMIFLTRFDKENKIIAFGINPGYNYISQIKFDVINNTGDNLNCTVGLWREVI